MTTWTSEQIEILIKEYGKIPAREIGEKFGYTEYQVRSKAKKTRPNQDSD